MSDEGQRRLDSFLFDNGYYDSRARAASAIKAGKVNINGKTISKPSAKINPDAKIVAIPEYPWVSRGGLKLDHALKTFQINVAGRTCLDVGASTGGFTDVLLHHGAEKIYAVDVGTDQLRDILRRNPKVVSLEQTDARNLTTSHLDPIPDLIVCDASFISAAKVLEVPLSLAVLGADLMTLIKPQFEVGKVNIGKGGIVKSPTKAKASLDDFSVWLSGQGWETIGTDVSPIKGGDGNTEYLLHARKRKPG